jgi:DMSO reductase family type II enzyme heme b subunit
MKRILSIVLCMLTAVAVFLVITTSQPTQKLTAQSAAGDTVAGKTVYTKNCSPCHGVEGKGDGTASVYLNPKPRDFARGVFKFRSTQSGSLPTDADLHRTLQNGMAGSAMPSWDRLTEKERNDAIAYIKTFSERFKREVPGEVLTIKEKLESSPELIAEGKAVYRLMKCWFCHGPAGKGDGPSSNTLKDDWERPIKAYNFTKAGAFKGGGKPEDIYRTFSTGIDGTPMPAYTDALLYAQESFADLASYKTTFSENGVQELAKYVRALPTSKQMMAMSSGERDALSNKRRWALVYYIISLQEPGKPPVKLTTANEVIISKQVAEGTSLLDPDAAAWNDAQPTDIALMALWQRESPTDRVGVRSLTNGKEIFVRLEWDDSTKDDDALKAHKFADAAAIQFPINEKDDPFFAMGEKQIPVNIWQWKSIWEQDVTKYAGVTTSYQRTTTDFYPFDVAGGGTIDRFEDAKKANEVSKTFNTGWGAGNNLSAQKKGSPVEELNAVGFGTLTSQPMEEQNVNGKGVWKDGTWRVVFTRSLSGDGTKDVNLKLGATIPIAFAVWNGSLGDRNGQKMVSNWVRMQIGETSGVASHFSPWWFTIAVVLIPIVVFIGVQRFKKQ